jgi:hypothetical protein
MLVVNTNSDKPVAVFESGIRIVTAHKDVQLLAKIAAAIMSHEIKSAGTK